VKKLALFVCAACLLVGMASAAQKAVLGHYAAAAKAADPAFTEFSAERGKVFFLAQRNINPDTPSCSSCHTTNPKNPGETRAGQRIEPMAVSVTPDRFTDLAKVEKWFRRNCDTVLKRECTPIEKGDFIAFMSSQ
jgi:cytochrome c peroxidase